MTIFNDHFYSLIAAAILAAVVFFVSFLRFVKKRQSGFGAVQSGPPEKFFNALMREKWRMTEITH